MSSVQTGEISSCMKWAGEARGDDLQYFSGKRIDGQYDRYVRQSNDIYPNAYFQSSFFTENEG